ncbi:unannotated protein [freshwater metagenome]|uniref:Unannotated protein n=1 Tax=freshwater metagenome TaxID=449393 RepID=A0A6J6EBG9_9ZZZZ
MDALAHILRNRWIPRHQGLRLKHRLGVAADLHRMLPQPHAHSGKRLVGARYLAGRVCRAHGVERFLEGIGHTQHWPRGHPPTDTRARKFAHHGCPFPHARRGLTLAEGSVDPKTFGSVAKHIPFAHELR